MTNINQYIKEQFSAMSGGSFTFKRAGKDPSEDIRKMANLSHFFFFSNLMMSKDMITGYLITLPKDLVDHIATKFKIEEPHCFNQWALIDKIIERVYI